MNSRSVLLRLLFIVVLVIFNLYDLNGDLIIRPEDRAVEVGETVKFQCKTTESIPVNWVFEGRPVYVGGNIALEYAERCTVNTAVRGEYILILHHVTLADGGTYMCEDNSGFGPDKSAAILTVGLAAPSTRTVTMSSPVKDDAMVDSGNRSVETTITVVVVPLLLILILVMIGALVIWLVIRHKRRFIPAKTQEEMQSLTQYASKERPQNSSAGGKAEDSLIPISKLCQSATIESALVAASREKTKESHEVAADEARSDHHTPVQLVRPARLVAVTFPCPLSGRCSDASHTWWCVTCKKNLLYDYDGNFYCVCGQARCETFTFRCSDTKHGEEFVTFTNSLDMLLKDYTAKLNVLLLGETGVGKSTFINGIANYLQFGKLADAKSDPKFLIPAFFITTGDKETYKSIRISTGGDPNEQQVEGKRATLSAKTHNLEYNGIHISIIDTPGIGNKMEDDADSLFDIKKHLLEFSEIHCIIILLRPNNSTLTLAFESCITQFLDVFKPYALKNIVICFTHCNETQYTPGDTLPVLKELLEMKNVDLPLNHNTMYCTDNEAVRYLAGVRQKVDVLESPKTRASCEKSWNHSAEETKRLVKYMLTLAPCRYRIDLNVILENA